ncbi:uncharacterized protein MYCFIDRAFT_210171 [Pseudocercospora fijiensis CIRAD86]|uniref:Uncharacterized protein n=1 Tax=Pseudocercospora fijiensis (strain CIRAD86) TaxID=383855 RepID=N1QCV8_PSEFD|nr:uncharacterized protein MYCFIDRAFT_210171 [Pseudocercospora fijiensis CIRAD86]EME89727.1 hypothetical protein MYCFIDRAFT_210171 [Pseudocercospora fijiensis CIRAD86]
MAAASTALYAMGGSTARAGRASEACIEQALESSSDSERNRQYDGEATALQRQTQQASLTNCRYTCPGSSPALCCNLSFMDRCRAGLDIVRKSCKCTADLDGTGCNAVQRQMPRKAVEIALP